MDGHEPFVSAVKSHIYLYLSCLNSNNKIFSEELSKKIEEKFLRLEAPFPYCARNALEDINIGGKVIKKGQRVIFFISAGNIDPYVFNDSKCPYSEEHPSKNLTFGVGRHYCLGANITRLSIKQFSDAFTQYIKENPKIHILKSEWKDTFGFRTLKDFAINNQ